MIAIDDMKFKDNLIPAIVQDHETREVLMFAYMNRQSLEKTLDSGIAHYWSRSRGKLWKKGESSGHIQYVKDILVDCDMDTLLLKVSQDGGACHVGYRSCFYRNIKGEIVGKKVFDPEDIY
ncbi:MAG: phosphoribosyl-AMP cyclohydrolase [Methanohalophilus sp.]